MNDLRAGQPRWMNELMIIPIERVSIEQGLNHLGFWVQGQKEPVAVIVRNPQGVRAFDTEAQQLSVEKLILKVEGLAEVLAQEPKQEHEK
ncbi:MAG: hypothetical protein ABFS45_18565 [Pseudomonadota bacterium]